ncbi:MAG: hypothetical protein NT127_05615 [Sphingobacteriales bacterium]|nr:hypothetical protein [Sphingobacteriales bacterium]
MRYIIILLLSFSFFVSKSQKIDYNNFDKKLFEKVLFDTLNHFRKLKKVEPLIWSNTMYSEITIHQMEKICKADYLHHPDLKSVWDSIRVRKLIGDESTKLVGVKTFEINSGPMISLFENCLFSNYKAGTYEELADYCIKLFDKSYMHMCTQYAPYKQKNKPGLASCTVGFTKRGMYVGFNFVNVHRD